jgi:hypothetical protein
MDEQEEVLIGLQAESRYAYVTVRTMRDKVFNMIEEVYLTETDYVVAANFRKVWNLLYEATDLLEDAAYRVNKKLLTVKDGGGK